MLTRCARRADRLQRDLDGVQRIKSAGAFKALHDASHTWRAFRTRPSGKVISLGFIPLVDAAPLIVARDPGFDVEERLSFDPHSAASWSMLRDMLTFGQVAAEGMFGVNPKTLVVR